MDYYFVETSWDYYFDNDNVRLESRRAC